MAKPKTDPQANPTDDATKQADASEPITAPPAAKSSKKNAGQTRPKKQNAAAAKSGSLLPSADKLEQLKAAVTLAGNSENLQRILQHVEQAGGIPEVTESIEAYRVLKTVLEE